MNSPRDVYQPLAHLGTAFRKGRLKDLGWRIETRHGEHPLGEDTQLMWVNRAMNLAAMEGLERHNGQLWHHVSVSHRDRQPTWDEMALVKRLFLGVHVEAYIVHPPESRYVNINPRVLHWYSSVDKPEGFLPDFRVTHAGQTGI